MVDPSRLRGNARPLSAQALDALVAGAAHPDGKVFALTGATQAMIRRALVDGVQRPTMLGFGELATTRITAAGREVAQRERERRLAVELGEPVEQPTTSWSVFGPCDRPFCGAKTSQPCLDLRGAVDPTGVRRELVNPHKGRRQVGPRADSLAHRTGRTG